MEECREIQAWHLLSAQDLNTNRIPYKLEDDERRMFPEELQK